MSGDRHPALRLDDPAHVLVETGIIDVDFVAAQLGRGFDSPESAAVAVVEAGDVSPHPLFESAWLARKKPWQRSGLHPVAWYVAERRRRNRLSPHPLAEARVILGAHPEAWRHPHGPLSYWLSVATPDTPLPTRKLPRKVTWGAYRRAAIEAARAWREETVGRRPALQQPHLGPVQPSDPAAGPDVAVVLVVRDEGPLIRQTIASVQAQSVDSWEMVAVDRGSADDSPAVLAGSAAFDERIRVVAGDEISTSEAVNRAVGATTAPYLLVLTPGRVLPDGFLQVLLQHARSTGAPLVMAAAGPVARSRGELLAGRPAALGACLVARDLLDEVGGADTDLAGAVARDLLLRLSARAEITPLDTPVGTLPPPAATVKGDDWEAFALARHLVDWSELPPAQPGTASVVMPLGNDVRRSVEAVTTLARERAQVVAVAGRARRVHHVMIGALARVVASCEFVSVPAEVNTSVATNVGISRATGETVVVVRAETSPPRSPVVAPLVEALAEPGVALAQPLCVDEAGVLVAAGAIVGRHPHPGMLLAGHHVSDAERIGPFSPAAPASPVVAARRDDLVRLGGLDARFRGPLAETDLGLRAEREGVGRTVVVPGLSVSVRGGYAEPEALVDALAAWVSRGHRPGDDRTDDVLFRAGFEVLATRNCLVPVEGALPTDPAVLVPVPVVRPLRSADFVNEPAPRLRWAIDIAAPAAPRGDKWGDSHFARSLADALVRRGQHVSIDRRDARNRDSRDHDDVLLVLRGLDVVAPRPGLVNLQWVISHPDMVTADEVRAFDKVYAASLSWAERVSRAWDVSVDPLLQCTDPTLFHPDRGEPDTGAEVLFVGNSRGVYRLAVRVARAIGAPLSLHGNDWSEFVPRSELASPGIANRDLGTAYASAGVVLNDHHVDMRRDGFISNRLFDAAACGARVASDPVEGIEGIFDGLVQVFQDEPSMARLLSERDQLFPDAEQRRKIAQRVLAEHTFDRRAETLVADAVQILRSQQG